MTPEASRAASKRRSLVVAAVIWLLVVPLSGVAAFQAGAFDESRGASTKDHVLVASPKQIPGWTRVGGPYATEQLGLMREQLAATGLEIERTAMYRQRRGEAELFYIGAHLTEKTDGRLARRDPDEFVDEFLGGLSVTARKDLPVGAELGGALTCARADVPGFASPRTMCLWVAAGVLGIAYYVPGDRPMSLQALGHRVGQLRAAVERVPD